VGPRDHASASRRPPSGPWPRGPRRGVGARSTEDLHDLPTEQEHRHQHQGAVSARVHWTADFLEFSPATSGPPQERSPDSSRRGIMSRSGAARATNALQAPGRVKPRRICLEELGRGRS
jgi:hypothetical protein